MNKFLKSYIVYFLPWFMWMIFGPMEIYMGNVNQYTFGYANFIYIMIGIALAGSIFATLIFSKLMKKWEIMIKTLVFAFSIGSYIQVMFLNTGIDLLGVSADATKISEFKALKNGIVWFIPLAILFLIYRKKKDISERIALYGSGFLLAIQLVALISLIITADSNAYKKSFEDITYISDEEEFVLSEDENIIVIILDYLSNQYIDPMLMQYPDGLDCLKDFVYYDNNDSCYFGTFPSLAHLATGQEVNPDIPVNEWFRYIWDNDKTKDFYREIKEQGYKCYFYTNDQTYLCGQNDAGILDGYIENLDKKSYVAQIDYKALIKTMTKFGGYRMVPYLFKPLLYTDLSEYYSMVQKEEGTVNSDNSVFMERVQNKELVLDSSNKRYQVIHLTGNHEFRTAADGTEKVPSTLDENTRGCMSVMEVYMNGLKEIGAYDNSTIIITSDHGGPRDSQSILFVKMPNQKQDEMRVCHAPTSFMDFQATIAKAAGMDHSKYGKAFDEIDEAAARERTVYVREMDKNYPKVNKYDANSKSTLNVYYAFTYTGDANDLMNLYDQGPSSIIKMYDSFY